MDNSTTLIGLDERVALLEKQLARALDRIIELERDIESIPDVAQRRELRRLKEKYKQQGMSGNQAKNAAWKELHRL
jgi:predicted phage-related endonuclease